MRFRAHERPLWCPHPDCQFVLNTQELACVGRLPKPELRGDLIRDEAMRLKPYRCSAGKLTIGVGRNLEDVGITRAEASQLLDNDLTRVFDELDRALPWWHGLPEPARRGLANMAFNLGVPRLLGFGKMLAALRAGDYAAAASEALDSKWARQVGARAGRIAALFRECAAEGPGL